MGQFLNSFIRGFGSTLGRAAARNAMQSSGRSEISWKGILITLSGLLILFFGISKLAYSHQKSHPSKYITFNVKSDDNQISLCNFEDGDGKSEGIGSKELFNRDKNGDLKLIPDTIFIITIEVYDNDVTSDLVVIKSDGYETQIIKIENKDTINVTLHKIK